MSFSSTQIRKLQRDVKACDIRTRELNGRELSYIEGWHAIAEANRIFGFDGWSRETVESRCLLSREIRGAFHALYIAKVRITVRADGDTIVREGFGTGEAQASATGEAHDKAIKTAETDATKRAFATFGKPFGLSLYLGKRVRGTAAPDIQRRRTLQRLAPNGRYYVASRPKQLPLDPALADNHRLGRDGTAAGPSPGSDHGPDLHDGDSEASEEAVPMTESAPLKQDRDQATAFSAKMAEYERRAKIGAAIVHGEPAISDTGLVPSPKTDTHADGIAYESGSLLLIDRPRRRRNPEHLKYVMSQPCLICSRTPSDAHHLKFAQPAAMSKKVSDEFTVPLCRTHHRQLHHAESEVNWWMDLDVDPLPIAQDLWAQSKAKRRTNGQ